jgi:hypothetical protein
MSTSFAMSNFIVSKAFDYGKICALSETTGMQIDTAEPKQPTTRYTTNDCYSQSPPNTLKHPIFLPPTEPFSNSQSDRRKILQDPNRLDLWLKHIKPIVKLSKHNAEATNRHTHSQLTKYFRRKWKKKASNPKLESLVDQT